MSEVLDERYLYTVNPKRVIRNLNENIPMLRASKSLFLTKEEVLKCLEYGSVYRRFSYINHLERVTKYDVDRVHRAKFISKLDWEKIEEKSKNIENLAINGTESNNGDPSVVVSEPVADDALDEDTKEELVEKIEDAAEVAATIKEEELPVETSGYIEVIEENGVPVDNTIPESVTTTNNEEPVEIEYSEIQPSEEIKEEINETIPEEEEIDESEEEDDVEEENIEAVEETSKSTSSVVVNYNGNNKKKKHKH